MYKINVKNSQIECENTGFLFQNTYYVDDTIQEGLPIATFCAIGNGVSAGKKQATLSQAGKDGKKASGVIYTTSPRDQYARRDDFSDEVMLFPYGRRQEEAIGLLKKCVIEISNGTKKHVFRTVDDLLVENATVAEKKKVTITNPIAVKYGDKIELIEKGGDSNKSTIHHIIAVNDKELTFTPEFNGSGNVDVVVKCQMDDPIYLNKMPVQSSGVYEKMEDLPFTTIRATAEGELDQLVGYIESPIAIRIDLNLDICPEKITTK